MKSCCLLLLISISPFSSCLLHQRMASWGCELLEFEKNLRRELLEFEKIKKISLFGLQTFTVVSLYFMSSIFSFRYNGYDIPSASPEQTSSVHSRPSSSHVRPSSSHRNSPRQSALSERYSAVSSRGLLGEEEKVDLRETEVSWIFIS